MDDIELLVAETFKHFHENYTEAPPEAESFTDLPESPGVIYHLQKTPSIFVIRTLVTANIRECHQAIIDRPEDYPSLRLIEETSEALQKKLRFFPVESLNQAEIIHDQLNNRRFPVNEETLCNLSDPGFSWWLTSKDHAFQVSFTMSVGLDESSVKLGPLGDHALGMKNFQAFSALLQNCGLNLEIQNEVNRVQFGKGEEFLLEELRDLFEFGVVSEGFKNLFKILARHSKDHSTIETIWFYLQELAAMRRFWIQLQYDLNS
jgi:hypothetical protein